ncbi:hypothetical protein CRYUN_Cryun19dG0157500 [Craigia yunnanensis]
MVPKGKEIQSRQKSPDIHLRNYETRPWKSLSNARPYPPKRDPHVVGPHGIPYLINLPGYGHRVKGELYSVSTRGLVRLDELEGTSIGHYERLPIQVCEEEEGGVLVAAKAYFAHGSFGERWLERKGMVGLNEFGEKEGKEYVRKEDRPDGSGFLHDITSFVTLAE